jgi:hypothetical protein
MEGIGGLHGWQWMFLIEAVPALLMTLRSSIWLMDQSLQWPNPMTQMAARPFEAERTNRETFFNMGWLSRCWPRVLALGILWFCAHASMGLNFFCPRS